MFERDTLTIRKTIDADGQVEVTVEGRRFSQTEFLAVLEASGFQTHSPLNFVLQGKAKQISQLDSTEIFQLFTQIVGSADYAQSREESENLLESTVLDENKSLELLEEFRERLTELEVDKEDFMSFETNLKACNQ